LNWENELLKVVSCPIKQKSPDELRREIKELLEAPAPKKKWEFDRRVALLRAKADMLMSIELNKRLNSSKRYRMLQEQLKEVRERLEELRELRNHIENEVYRIEKEYSQLLCDEINSMIEKKIDQWLKEMGGVR